MEFREKTKESISALFIGLIALVIALFFIKVINNWGVGGDANTIKKNIEDIRKSISPYEYKDNLNKAVIISGFKNTAVKGKFSDTFEKKIIMKGDIKEGFLYVKASVEGRPLGEWDRVYVKLRGSINKEDKEYGGHLVKAKSLETPSSDSFTEFLFNLSDVKYQTRPMPTDIEIVSGDWLKILNEANLSIITGFSSTERAGNIEEIAIYYECVERGSCSIDIQ